MIRKFFRGNLTEIVKYILFIRLPEWDRNSKKVSIPGKF